MYHWAPKSTPPTQTHGNSTSLWHLLLWVKINSVTVCILRLCPSLHSVLFFFSCFMVRRAEWCWRRVTYVCSGRVRPSVCSWACKCRQLMWVTAEKIWKVHACVTLNSVGEKPSQLDCRQKALFCLGETFICCIWRIGKVVTHQFLACDLKIDLWRLLSTENICLLPGDIVLLCCCLGKLCPEAFLLMEIVWFRPLEEVQVQSIPVLISRWLFNWPSQHG